MNQDQLIEGQIRLEKSIGGLYHFNNEVLDYKEMAESPHRLMCDSVQNGGRRQLHLWPRGHFKAVDLNYPVFTPSGFKKHGELKVGDFVYGSDGYPTKIIAKTPIFDDADCYEVFFSDNTSVKVSGDHLWRVDVCSCARIGYKNRREKWTKKLINTRELLQECQRSQTYRSRPYPTIPVVKIADGSRFDYPAYIIGLWLGDGTRGKNDISTSAQDIENLTRNIEDCGIKYKIHKYKRGLSVSVDYGIKNKKYSSPLNNVLRKLGIFKEKFIPFQLLHSSLEDRQALLEGLMDTDGSCERKHGQCIYCSASERLANDVYVLCQTLGLNPSLHTRYGLYKNRERRFFQITFNGHRREPVFRLERKLKYLSNPQYPRRKRIINVISCPSVPVSCIEVENKDGIYLIGRSLISTHNSSMITIGYVIYRIAQNPNIRILIANATLQNAKSFLREIKGHFERNEKLRAIIGDQVNRDDKWTETEIIVRGRSKNLKEPTIQVAGVGQSLVSQHYDCLVPETEVLTSNGFIKAEKLRKGLRVLSSDGKFHSIVKYIQKESNKDIVEILPQYQVKSSKFTKDHRIYVWSGDRFEWKTAGEITEKDMLVVPRCRSKNSLISKTNKRIANLAKNKDIWRLIGYWLAEGCRTVGGGQIRLTFSNKEMYLAKDAQQIVKSVLGQECSIRETKNSTLMVCFSDNDFKELTKKCGDRAGNKIIPPFFLNNTFNLQRELLVGYFRGDGCICGDTVSFSSISKDLLSGIQLLLTKIGIPSSFSISKKEEGMGLVVNNICHFNRSWNLSTTHPLLKVLLGIEQKQKEFKPFRSFFTPQFWVVPIRKIRTRCYSGMVYDIQVADTHDFYCNGLVVHNCIVADDIVNTETVNTPEQIEKTKVWFKLCLSLLDPSGDVVVIGTRYHFNDLYAWLIKEHSQEYVPQVHSCYNESGEPIFPSRFSKEVLEEIKKAQGSYLFSTQYLNNPVDDESAKFKKSWIKYLDKLPDKQFYTTMTVDRAYSLVKTADYTGISVRKKDQENFRYFPYARRARYSESELINKIFDLRKHYSVDKVGIEQSAFEFTLRPILEEEMRRRDEFFEVVEIKTKTSKIQRIESQTSYFESGSVYFVGEPIDFVDLEDEMLRFPVAEHDDILDALAMNDDEEMAGGLMTKPLKLEKVTTADDLGFSHKFQRRKDVSVHNMWG